MVDPKVRVHVNQTRQNGGIPKVDDIGTFLGNRLRTLLNQADPVAIHPDRHRAGPARIAIP